MTIRRAAAAVSLALAVTGIGLATASTADAATYPCSVGQTLRQGNENACVKALQTYLNGYQDADLARDSDFGPKTYSAVRTYQSKLRIDVDGVVGQQTRDTICSHTGIPVNSGATHAQIVAAGDAVMDMCYGWGYHFN